jgi:hypothetical protein
MPGARRWTSGDMHRHRPVRGAAILIGDELHHLGEIAGKGESPLTMLIVLAEVLLMLSVIVAVELVVTFAFYFAWL